MTDRRIVLALSALALGAFAPAAQAVPILYGATGNAGDASTPPVSNLYTIDAGTGAATAIGPIGFSITGLAVDRKGTLYGATAGVEAGGTVRQLLTIDTKTGAGTVAGSLGANEIEDLAFDSGNRLWGWNTLTSRLTFITRAPSVTAPDTGRSGLTPGLTFGGGLAFGKNGALYGLLTGDDGYLWNINPATGAATVGPRLTNSPNQTGATMPSADFACDGRTLYSVVNDYGDPPTFLVTVDTETGAIKTKGTTLPNLDAIAFAGCNNDGVGPRLSLRSPAKQKLSTLRGAGLEFKMMATDEAARFKVRLRARFTKAGGGRGELVTVGTVTAPRTDAKQEVTVTVKPTATMLRRLQREKRLPGLLSITATDDSGARTTRTKRLYFS